MRNAELVEGAPLPDLKKCGVWRVESGVVVAGSLRGARSEQCSVFSFQCSVVPQAAHSNARLCLATFNSAFRIGMFRIPHSAFRISNRVRVSRPLIPNSAFRIPNCAVISSLPGNLQSAAQRVRVSLPQYLHSKYFKNQGWGRFFSLVFLECEE